MNKQKKENINIINKLSKVKDWLEKYDSLVDLSIIEKFLFLFTNVFYFVPIVLYGINTITIITTLMGLISSSFHSCQCCLPCPHNATKSLL